ncbi:hypothetical protein V6N13_059770 [Hibiscus sabdariffa]|uniref:Secreted protein n=1 Tax=Hibiscus sabdariffa TaxID=183260 RepID=A0ABR2GC07_9ROSI
MLLDLGSPFLLFPFDSLMRSLALKLTRGLGCSTTSANVSSVRNQVTKELDLASAGSTTSCACGSDLTWAVVFVFAEVGKNLRLKHGT